MTQDVILSNLNSYTSLFKIWLESRNCCTVVFASTTVIHPRIMTFGRMLNAQYVISVLENFARRLVLHILISCHGGECTVRDECTLRTDSF